MKISVKRLDTGYVLVSGGPYLSAQVPQWPCDEPTFRAHMSNLTGISTITRDAFVAHAMVAARGETGTR